VTRVLGVDPGSSATGWAVVEEEAGRCRLVTYGVVRPARGDRAPRLAALARMFSEVVEEHRPDCAAVESSFAGRNARTSLVLAESRGVLLAVLGRVGVEVFSYSPAQVKSALVGHGSAEKRQVAFMVERLLGLSERPPSDAADAIAAAITHVHLGGWERRRREAGGVS